MSDRNPDSPPLHLRIFYNRQQDRDACVAGLESGLRAVETVEFQGVADNMALQKFLLFNGVTTDLHYTVFTDSDVWFTPDFWTRYMKLLRGMKPSYASVYTRNIPRRVADKLVDGGQLQFTAQQLDAVADRQWRHNDLHGTPGVFQCIPTGMLKYPAVKHSGVDHYDCMFAMAAKRLGTEPRLAFDARVPGTTLYHLDHARNWQGSLDER